MEATNITIRLDEKDWIGAYNNLADTVLKSIQQRYPQCFPAEEQLPPALSDACNVPWVYAVPHLPFYAMVGDVETDQVLSFFYPGIDRMAMAKAICNVNAMRVKQSAANAVNSDFKQKLRI